MSKNIEIITDAAICPSKTIKFGHKFTNVKRIKKNKLNIVDILSDEIKSNLFFSLSEV